MVWPFLVGIGLYSLAAIVAYHTPIRNSAWYYPLGLFVALACNLTWLYLARSSVARNDLISNSITWDAMRLMVYTGVPLAFFGAELSPVKIAGACLIGLGIYLVNWTY
jgi:multidrug transporter EmrE-like cation transporter